MNNNFNTNLGTLQSCLQLYYNIVKNENKILIENFNNLSLEEIKEYKNDIDVLIHCNMSWNNITICPASQYLEKLIEKYTLSIELNALQNCFKEYYILFEKDFEKAFNTKIENFNNLSFDQIVNYKKTLDMIKYCKMTEKIISLEDSKIVYKLSNELEKMIRLTIK